MIEKWRLSNFKSIYDPAELELRPLTLFAGANSSGKSTFIQSMLLVAQTLTNQVYSRPIILNGHIARLGEFRDLVSSGSGRDEIAIGFSLSGIRQVHRGNEFARPYFPYPESDINSLSCDFAFSATGEASVVELLQLQPRLTHCVLRSTHSEPHPATVVEIKRSALSPEQREQELHLTPEELSPADVASLSYEVVRAEQFTGRYFYRKMRTGTPVGCTLSHFLPSLLTLRYNATEERAEEAVTYLFSPDFRRGAAPSAELEQFFTPQMVSRAEQLFRDLMPEGSRKIQIPADVTGIGRIGFLRKEFFIPQNQLERSLSDYREELRTLAIDGKATRWALASHWSTPEENNFLQYFFGEMFKYLGPLRDEPKAVYPLEGARSPWDLGLRGEYTAAVLDLYKNTNVSYIPSEVFLSEDPSSQLKTVSLQEAVLDWLKYLDISQKVATKDLGLLGHDLRVAVGAEDSLHQLVHVGVGVSQVLPILVTALLAAPESVLVFEQPELHLNPKVQTLLGDFLLSVVRSGKQCIVETHSEYIINRLRYRAAQDPHDRMSSELGLYFVEKQGPKSHYRFIRVNAFGAIDDWPQGFFDQSPREAEMILRAAVAKRRKRGKRNV